MSSTESSGTSVEKNEQVNNEETSQKSPTSTKPFDSSYYKWSKKINQSKEELAKLGVDIAPKKIESPAEVEPTVPKGVSAWNFGNTWEEIDRTNWSKTRIAEILKQDVFEQSGFTINIVEVEKCDGYANFIYSKGKLRPGFDFNLKLKWEASKEGESEKAKGTFCIEEFSDMCGDDYEVKIRAEKGDSLHTNARSAVTKAQKEILKDLKQWKDEFYKSNQ